MRQRRWGRQATRRVASVVVFSIGLVLGTILISIAAWGDFEAILFNPGIRQSATLRGLRCPIAITDGETGTVSARIRNTLDRATSFYVRAHISEGYVTLMREEIAEISLGPGEADRITWSVTAEDAAFGRLVLFKVTTRGGYPLPTRQATCGILVVQTPPLVGDLSGNAIYAIGTALSLACTLGGGALWLWSTPHRLGVSVQITRAMGFLTVCTLVGITFGVLEWWLLGGLVLVVILVTVGVIIGYLVTSARR